MLRALFYISLLVAVLAAAYFLPKLVQSSEKFKPLAEDMAHDMAPPAPVPVPEPPKPKPAPVPDPVVAATPTPATVEAPSPAISPVVPPAAAPPKTADPAPDLSPFVAALASGDLPKAGAILDLLRPKLEAAKYAELSQSLELTRSREAEKAKAAMASDKTAAETQALMVAALKQLQQSQQETSKLLAEMKNAPVPAPAPNPTSAPVPAALSAPAPAPAPEDPASTGAAAAPLPGTVVLRYGFDSSLLEDEEAAKLKPILAALSSDAKAKVEIRGYADKRGKSSYNLGLSAARAQSVKDALRREGVEDGRIEVVSFGSFQAKTASSDEAADFRKVEVLLIH